MDGGAEDEADDGDDVNVGETNSSVAEPRVDNAGGMENGSFLGRDIHVLFNRGSGTKYRTFPSRYDRNCT